jgi:adenylate cyclase
MGVEIERKFLPASDAWRAVAKREHATRIRQGFLARDVERVVRVRLETPLEGGRARTTLTIKGKSEGARRSELEYDVPAADGEALLALCLPGTIEKVRWRVDAGGGLVFEIDEFEGRHVGLVVVEIELDDESREFTQPAWLGREVTGDPAYTNAVLSRGG